MYLLFQRQILYRQQMQHNRSYNQSGTAILMALFITAIVAIITGALLTRQQIDIARTALSINANQAYLYVNGAEIWAEHLLQTNIYPTTTQNTNLLAWPKYMPKQKLENGGTVSATLMDAQSFFNINNLQDTTSQQAFEKLLNTAVPAQGNQQSSNTQQYNNLITNISNWITPANQSSNVSFDEYYMNLPSPYRTAHQAFTSISELRLVNGITPAIYNYISPYIIALPNTSATTTSATPTTTTTPNISGGAVSSQQTALQQNPATAAIANTLATATASSGTNSTTPLNINTAPAMLFTTLSPNLSLSQAQEIINLRQEHGGFANTQDFLSIPSIQNLQINGSAITTTSQYFLLRTDVILNHQKLTVFSLLERVQNQNQNQNSNNSNANNQYQAVLLWHSIGTM